MGGVASGIDLDFLVFPNYTSEKGAGSIHTRCEHVGSTPTRMATS